jgi:signal transduction histidine kinase
MAVERMTLAGRFDRLSVRHKLLALVLVPLLLVLPALGVVLLAWGNSALDQLLITKIRSDLAVAQGYFERVLGEVGSSTASVAESHALHQAIEGANEGRLVALLQALREREGLDFIQLRRPDGSLWLGDSGPARGPEPTSPTSPARAAVAQGGTSVEVLTPEQLAVLGPTLAARVSVPLVDTLNAAPTDRAREDRAMVLLSTRAVLGTDARPLGHLQAGLLLNRNLPFIDHINQIVYPAGSLPYGSRGTATLFLDDVRISTNVRLFGAEQDERAIGTRVSQAVREVVLGSGRTWLDRAFVVNDWYVSAYEPIQDSAGRRVGMLYVGFTEEPFRWIKMSILLAIGVTSFLVMIGGAWVSLRWARRIFAPLETMAATMRRVEEGELQARVGGTGRHDEIGQLAGHLDHLLDTIDDKTRALQRWNAELDAKVSERTQELEAAQGQLVRSEKLATVGQLTASIAHEVNNPIAVIQGNLDLMRELLGPDASKVRAEMKLVDEQIERMRLIVTQLLQYARPTEFAGYVEALDPNRLVEESLVLAGHQLSSSGITVQQDLRATRQPAVNRGEMQQVMVNLLVNAIQAMPHGGTLTLRSRDLADAAGPAVQWSVQDTGPGLSPELLSELFKPFVTRRKDGTGLGLWISRNLVERYGGTLQASVRTDGVSGAVFTVRLPA